ncbi:hypothetical protein J18TS1_20860 [Oceanobacillus oncorhynchi subsp. incaldanensis]|nr:hypothetical protein J18TS1_20860 [Oceanobacillus oncorhynchi subsp. incaldanensis]
MKLFIGIIENIGYSVSLNKKEKFLKIEVVVQEGLKIGVCISFFMVQQNLYG